MAAGARRPVRLGEPGDPVPARHRGRRLKIAERVRALLGRDAVLEDTGAPDGVPRVAPGSPDAVALLLRAAREEGWRVRVEGAGTWLPADAPADLALTTRRLDRIPAIQPQDLTATAEAGIGCDQLRQELADRGVWLALDPPGLAGRTLGSLVATATAGPLRHGFGAVRDHLLGVTFVTGDGRLIQSGGRVMKNVAGYDLTKLQAGGFGAFGVIVLVHLRLRALPRVDQTLVLEGSREDLSRVADDISAAGLTLAALELLSPALARRERWALAVRLVGSVPLVAAEEAGLRAATGGQFSTLRAEEAHAFWMRAAETFATRPITFRIGGLPDSSDELLDLVQHQVGDEWVSASPGAGTLRWAGEATADRLRRLRRALAAREVPLTIERAPWAVRRAVGHFGAYREGAGPLIAGLRHTFDPGNALAVAVESDDRAG
jgi:glycolate oxidase FAD binding subunit